MDYGGNERRKTKKDLKRKRLVRGYKRGGQFRTYNISEVEGKEKSKKVGVLSKTSHVFLEGALQKKKSKGVKKVGVLQKPLMLSSLRSRKKRKY